MVPRVGGAVCCISPVSIDQWLKHLTHTHTHTHTEGEWGRERERERE